MPAEKFKDCTVWTGTKQGRGYGAVRVNGKLMQAHRWVWEQANEPIPDGLVVMHLCDNPPCVNLEHLRLGTQSENILDMVAKGKHWKHQNRPTHCRHGHELLPENTYQYADGRRHCKECRRNRYAS